MDYFKHAQTSSRSQAADETYLLLLRAIKNKRQVWADHASRIILPIIQILAHTDNVKLQSECLNAIVTNWGSRLSLVHTRMLLSYEIPQKLLQLLHNLASHTYEQLNAILRSDIPIIFGNLVGHVRGNELTSKDTNMLASFLDATLRDNLLSTLVRDILKLEVSPRTSSLQGQESVHKVWSPRFSRTVTLYDETCDYLNRISSPGSGEGSKEAKVPQRLHENDFFLDTLFKLQGGLGFNNLPPPTNVKCMQCL